MVVFVKKIAFSVYFVSILLGATCQPLSQSVYSSESVSCEAPAYRGYTGQNGSVHAKYYIVGDLNYNQDLVKL